jgi:U3 small nucleolar RNA-associated protein 15
MQKRSTSFSSQRYIDIHIPSPTTAPLTTPQDGDARQQTLTVITALVHRSALRTALSNRDSLTLQPILRWSIKNISDYRITRLVTDVALQVLDLYADQLGRSPEVDMLVEQLMQRVKVVVEASQVAWSVLGMTEMLTNGVLAGEAAIEE